MSEVSADHEDRRIGGIHFTVVGIARQIRRQVSARRIDGRLHVSRGGIDIAVQVELQGDAAVIPRVLDEVISVTAAMRPNCRSSGVATDEAMVSGLAPGSAALTEMVGKSTCGRGDTGRIESHDARQRNGHRQQRGRHRPVNEGRGNIHSSPDVTPRGIGSDAAMALSVRKPPASRSKNR